ncbi:hypothetical protein [Salipaludibacillus aurantiacus]|uniref:Uncharacterized protein n=1 Tax=Salipaludibacillus aurantiacus TaxID=1601833 RepID=A0A1H9V4C1_9BACI|nr:hypothetical protein [Salipaludibacillus aurantiacus]SES16234.1 hypothetical protein SAMN05518684_109133 [Salipaludibacillus aurantiacus]
MFKWVPHKEQYICERRLKKVMKRLKIEVYNYNWDRSSCFIEFQHQENKYRMEHSLQRAKEKGLVMLRNGLDCLNELIKSLEHLCEIVDRGTYRLDTWIASMKLPSPVEETPEYMEEVQIRYKSTGKQHRSQYHGDEELEYTARDSSLGDFEKSEVIPRYRSE